MRLLLRVAAIAVAGVALFEAGTVNGLVQLQPSPAGGLFAAAAVAAALVLMAMALSGTGRADALAAAPATMVTPIRLVFLFVSFSALIGLAWLRGIPYPPLHDETPYHNDAIALNECAARTLLTGNDPYRELGLFDCYAARQLGADRTTPLRRGAFADLEVYPTEEQLDAAWLAAQRAGARCVGCLVPMVPPDLEFVWRVSYPALAFVLLVPWVVLGLDTNVLYLLCLLAAMALVVARTPAGSRPFILTGLLAAFCLTAFTVGGSADVLYALPLVAAWLWRERRWSALALGAAMAVKQLAWPFAAFYLIQVVAAHGWREALRRAAIAGGLFVAVDLPFVMWDAQAWVLGVLTPVSEPMFARGVGLVSLGINGAGPLLPSTAYLVLEGLFAIGALLVGWRTRRTSPELGVVLAMLPLYFAWRSLFSYFFLLPLFALAGLARMPAGALSAETARASGAVTVIAMPSRARPAAPR